MNSVGDVWSSIIDIVRPELTPVAITTWFEGCEVIDISETTLTVLVPTEFKRSVLSTRFMPHINSAVKQLFGAELNVILTVTSESDHAETDTANVSDPAESGEYTFDNFVVGPSNKLAHAAALAVAEEQTKIYNPLFIYGDSGLGKTHLLYAIMHRIRRRHPDYNIVFVRTRDFMNELITAIRAGHNVEFREKYRSADLFLMDDIQAIAATNTSQEECFHTFNSLYEAGKQIVFASDRPPSEMQLLTDRLRTRFESGLLADIQKPDFETRIAIIKNKSVQLGLVLPDDVTAYIAQNMTANVRQLEGAVKKIRAYSDMMEDKITVNSVSRALKDMFKEKTAYTPTPDDIIEETAHFFNLTAEELRGQRRTRNTATARQIAMYQIRTLTNLSLQDIGNIFGGRDHTTVLSSINKIEEQIGASEEFAQIIRDITATINSK